MKHTELGSLTLSTLRHTSPHNPIDSIFLRRHRGHLAYLKSLIMQVCLFSQIASKQQQRGRGCKGLEPCNNTSVPFPVPEDNFRQTHPPTLTTFLFPLHQNAQKTQDTSLTGPNRTLPTGGKFSLPEECGPKIPPKKAGHARSGRHAVALQCKGVRRCTLLCFLCVLVWNHSVFFFDVCGFVEGVFFLLSFFDFVFVSVPFVLCCSHVRENGVFGIEMGKRRDVGVFGIWNLGSERPRACFFMP